MNKFFQGFKYAFNGWILLFKSELNAKVHLFASVISFGLSIFLQLNYIEWALVILCVFGVLAAEGMNTAIEILANRISKERDDEIKKAKDVAAGAVLFASLAAAAIGCILFLPKIILLIQDV